MGDMNQESVVYGCIKDTADGGMDERRQVNKDALEALPAAEFWPVISREMFSMSHSLADNVDEIALHTQVTHFGASYNGIEYEWQHWLEQFEALLRQMYWVSATVHLETEISGTHSFVWHTDTGEHKPGAEDIKIRCEWIHDA